MRHWSSAARRWSSGRQPLLAAFGDDRVAKASPLSTRILRKDIVVVSDSASRVQSASRWPQLMAFRRSQSRYNRACVAGSERP
jgi:hypothetical protein